MNVVLMLRSSRSVAVNAKSIPPVGLSLATYGSITLVELYGKKEKQTVIIDVHGSITGRRNGIKIKINTREKVHTGLPMRIC